MWGCLLGVCVKPLIEYIARALASSPEEVEVSICESPKGPVCTLKVAEEDVGKIIGRDGRTIHALRTVASSCLRLPESKLQLDVEGKKPSAVAPASPATLVVSAAPAASAAPSP